MITMVDEIFDRNFQAGRAEFNAALLGLGRKLRDTVAPAFLAIHHFEWDAPWTSGSGPKAKA